MSYSGCSSGGYSGGHSGGCCGSGISGYSESSGSPGYSAVHSIDSIISSYTGPVASAMESSVQQQQYHPTFFESDGPKAGYGISESINAAIYGGIGTGYSSNSQSRPGQSMSASFNPNIFLNRDRPASPFVGSSEDIKHYIKDAFEKTTGRLLPDDLMIRVVDQHELRQLHEEFGGEWSPGIQGISVNKKGFSQSIIVVKENELDRLLVTIGHEIGHVINFPLTDKLDEEAKAFAFEMAWLKAMYEHDIAGLKNSLNPDPQPARNGLHDVAFSFVRSQMIYGKKPLEIADDLMKMKVSVREKINCRGDGHVWM